MLADIVTLEADRYDLCVKLVHSVERFQARSRREARKETLHVKYNVSYSDTDNGGQFAKYF